MKTVTVPDNFCERCNGSGTQALHGIAITADEFNGPEWDDESRDAYLSGEYDTLCSLCGGSGSIDPEEAEYKIEIEHEQRMGY